MVAEEMGRRSKDSLVQYRHICIHFQPSARAWSTEDEKLKLEDVDCDGCTIGKRLLSPCAVCDVRMCGLQRNVENCAHCDEFPCGRLEKHWRALSSVSEKKAKANLHEIRKSRT